MSEQHLFWDDADEGTFTEGFFQALRTLCARGGTFRIWDVRAEMMAAGIDLDVYGDLRRFGPLMKAAQAAGLCRPVGSGRTKNPARNGGYETAWKPL